MATMTAAQADELWAGVDDQRTRTVALLEGLTPAQWDTPSLCDGWTVRHVAAHLTGQQLSVGDVLRFIGAHPRILRSVTLNAAIHESAVILAGALSTEEIVDRIRATIGSRRHNVFVTPREAHTDILVHSQDIALPLGIDLPIRPGPGALSATRCWDTRGSWLSSVFRTLPLDGYRLTATDTGWTRGEGLDVEGPVGAILLLLSGRPVALDQLTGEGAEALRASLPR